MQGAGPRLPWPARLCQLLIRRALGVVTHFGHSLCGCSLGLDLHFIGRRQKSAAMFEIMALLHLMYLFLFCFIS